MRRQRNMFKKKNLKKYANEKVININKLPE